MGLRDWIEFDFRVGFEGMDERFPETDLVGILPFFQSYP